MSVVLVAVGAAVGAPLRWWIDQWVQRRWTPVVPWGTFAVNVLGSFVLGALVGATPQQPDAVLLLGVGLCGALTTFSSFAWETYRLVEDGARALGLLNVVLSVVVCFGAAGLGYWVVGAGVVGAAVVG